MESKYYLHRKSNRLVRISSRNDINTYFMDYVNPPFHGKVIERAALELLIKFGNYIPVNQNTAQVLYGS